MRAARLHQYRDPLRLEQAAEPQAAGPTDVIVRVGAAGVCRTDLHIQDGMLADVTAAELPFTLGHETAGWVHEVGAGVATVAPGDPVLVHPLVTCGLCRACRAGDDMRCVAATSPGIDCDGGFAELMRTNERGVVRLPAGTRPADVVALTDAGITAYHAAKKASAVLHPGSWVVVQGIGGLGHVAVQCLAAMSAAQIVAVDRSEAALELARECGAHHTVLADGGQVAAVAALHGEEGVDAIVDFVGKSEALETGIDMLRRLGTYFHVGYGDRLDVPAVRIVAQELSFVGNFQGSFTELTELADLHRQGRIQLHTTEYPFDELNAVLDELRAGNVQGRAYVAPAAEAA